MALVQILKGQSWSFIDKVSISFVISLWTDHSLIFTLVSQTEENAMKLYNIWLISDANPEKEEPSADDDKTKSMLLH